MTTDDKDCERTGEEVCPVPQRCVREGSPAVNSVCARAGKEIFYGFLKLSAFETYFKILSDFQKRCERKNFQGIFSKIWPAV
jgi:hypothetical protein